MVADRSSPDAERSASSPAVRPEGETPPPDRECSLPGPCFGPCLFPLASHRKADALVENHRDDASSSDDESSSSSALMQTAQYAASVALLTLCVALCTVGILARRTPVAADVPPALAIGLMWILIWWLGILEGAQGCLVGLQPVDPEQYRHTHDYTYACTRMAHRGDNLNKFIVGRQFLVVLVVFLLNLVCTAVEGSIVPGVPPALFSGLVASGLAVMIITVMLGQLSAEVNATNCMFDFVNSRVVWITTALCLVIEGSGLLHAVYLIQSLFGFVSPGAEAGTGCDGDAKKKSPAEHVWYWTRMAASVALLSAAMAVTCDALWHDETTMVPGPNTVASFAVFVGFVGLLGILEAIQIAAFAVVKLPPGVVAANPSAEANCALVFRGRNFKALLIGRQILVTTSMFFLARITTTSVDPGNLADTSTTMSTVLGIPPSLQLFFNTGLPGALITTIVASLWWRIAAARFPVAFMANPVVGWTVRLCLCLEATGVFSASWLLADGIRWMMGIQPDDAYLAAGEVSEEDLECRGGEEEDLEWGKSETSTLLTQSSSSNENIKSYTDPMEEFHKSGRSRASTLITEATSVSDDAGSYATLDDVFDKSGRIRASTLASEGNTSIAHEKNEVTGKRTPGRDRHAVARGEHPTIGLRRLDVVAVTTIQDSLCLCL